MPINLTAPEIADALAADVHNGVLQAGDMLPSERDLCERFGVGRSTVRESMTILQGIRLVDHTKGKRPRVLAPSLSEVMAGVAGSAKFFFDTSEGRAHLEQARIFLETSLLRYAIEHVSNAQLARLVSAVDECEANITDANGFREADVKFHRILAGIPGNPIFTSLHEAFVENLMKSRPLLDDSKVRNKESNNEHRQIVEALIDKDVDKAIVTLNRHLTRNYGTYFHQALKHPKP